MSYASVNGTEVNSHLAIAKIHKCECHRTLASSNGVGYTSAEVNSHCYCWSFSLHTHLPMQPRRPPTDCECPDGCTLERFIEPQLFCLCPGDQVIHPLYCCCELPFRLAIFGPLASCVCRDGDRGGKGGKGGKDGGGSGGSGDFLKPYHTDGGVGGGNKH